MLEKCDTIMKRQVATLKPEATLVEAARLMKAQGCGLIPICDKNEVVVGVLTDRDIVVRACARGLPLETTAIHSVMTKSILSCAPNDPVSYAEELMTLNKIYRVLVLDSGRLVGLISLTDIAHCEEPIRTARLLRDLSSREYRLESP